MGLHLLVYDRTYVGRPVQQLGLTSSWIAGSALYRALGRVDASRGVTSWAEAFTWLASESPGQSLEEVQFWGHGRWGRAFIGREAIDDDTVAVASPHRAVLEAIRGRMGPSGLWWFRTCETFGRARGHAFATSWTRFFGCRTAGHTYVIGPWQSGLHSLSPGDKPTWSTGEGLAAGVEDPRTALMSSASAPNTITCLHGAVPTGW